MEAAKLQPVADANFRTEIPRMLKDLRATFDSGRTRTLAWRLQQLEGLQRLVNENEDRILEALAKDVGKPDLEAFMTEVASTIDDIDLVRKKLPGWMKPQKVSAPIITQPAKATIYRDPLGVVLVIAPWNYPFTLAVAPLIGAISAGNCVVVKPSEVAPATASLLAELVSKYLDGDAVRVYEGAVEETTCLLEERWDYIFYTGNGTVGRIVMAAAAKHLTPVTLELGGKSPAIVDDDVDLGGAVKRILWGKFSNSGQTCVAPDYVLAHEKIHDKLLEKFKSTLLEFYGDDPQKSRDYGRVVNARHHQRLMKLLEGQDVVVGGQADESDRYIAPTILQNVSPDAPVMADEIFGPILPVLKISDVDEAVSFINARPKPLALYVFSNRGDVQEDILSRTSSGGATINHAWLHMAVPDLPFGGVGESGMGAYHGRGSFDTFTHHKSVLKKPTGMEPNLMYPPYTDRKRKWIKRLI